VWTGNGARLAVAAPWIVLLFMSFNRDIVQAYTSPGGVVVIIVGGGVCLVAYRLMVRLGRLPEEQRVLR
jgi:tight adherence protein B